MRLIKTSTLSLERFYGDEIPAYVILSHTWGDDEVSLQEFTKSSETKNDRIANKAGYRKIAETCDQALEDGYHYAWVDACCIDNTSSSELTESINSMFGWYRELQVCYAYLSDFLLDMADVSSQQAQFDANFRRCRWFTRGWCLQELLAPRHLRFFNHKWQEIGTKSSLSRLISDITGIPEDVLTVPPKKGIRDFPVATRISWIAKRQTTRIEDMSYSLLGILDINMPMVYGEGNSAFLRLQEEIIRKYNDLSIFAWTGAATASGFMPMLAANPSSFTINRTDYYGRNSTSQLGNRLGTQFSLTNQGIFFPSANLHYQTAVPGYRHQYLLFLDYRDPSFWGKGKQRYIILQKIGAGLFVRLHDSLGRLKAFQKRLCTSPFSEPACILNRFSEQMTRQLALWERYCVRLRWKPWEKLGQRYWHIRTVQPRASWDCAANQFLLEMAHERHMHVEFVPGNYESNPSSKFFVLAIEIGVNKKQKRNPSVVSARIISADIWQGLNVTMLGFRGREALALDALPPPKATGDSDYISLAGYDISVSVRLVTEPNEQAYHLVYIDWEVATP